MGREVEGGGGMRAQELYKSRGPGSPVGGGDSSVVRAPDS